MPRKTPYARIAITLPAPVLATADRLAKRLDRSRSWVIAEAVRQFASGAQYPEQSPRHSTVREPVASAFQAGQVAEARVRLLESGLAQSPAERLQRAEELLQLARLARPRGRRKQVVAFDSWEEFALWKAAQRIRP